MTEKYPTLHALSGIWLRTIRFVASLLPKREIYAEDFALYLERFRIFGWTEGSSWKGPSLYLHRFHLPDQDVALHNYPWRRAYSLILSGSYDEFRGKVECDKLECFDSRSVRAGRINTIGPDDYHRIAYLHGEVWTLFFVWPKSRSWGFWIPGRGHVEWKQRLLERGIEA